MKWLIIFGIIGFVLYQNQIKDKDESSSASSVSPENQTLAQTLKGNLVNHKGQSVTIDTSKKYIVLYNGASW
ncbi:MAG: hypothetical protein NE327_03455 [Lentisphaeraceae bacterium]|nr:hypothetical protein [Lentisphaeraceae bacterium]